MSFSIYNYALARIKQFLLLLINISISYLVKHYDALVTKPFCAKSILIPHMKTCDRTGSKSHQIRHINFSLQ